MKTIRNIAILVTALFAGSAIAQSGLILDAASGAVGDTIEVPIHYQAKAGVAGMAIVLKYDTAVLAPLETGNSFAPTQVSAGSAAAKSDLDVLGEVGAFGNGTLLVAINPTLSQGQLDSGIVARVPFRIIAAPRSGESAVSFDTENTTFFGQEFGVKYAPEFMDGGAVFIVGESMSKPVNRESDR